MTAADCGLYCGAPNNGSFLTNPELRKPYARHLGGVNVGWMDGHASWVNSQTLINRVAGGRGTRAGALRGGGIGSARLL